MNKINAILANSVAASDFVMLLGPFKNSYLTAKNSKISMDKKQFWCMNHA